MARWADWQGRAKQISIAAIASEGATPMMFVSNELLVDSEDGDLVAELTSMGATIVPQLPLQPLPFGMERRELTGEFPMPVRLQFAEPPRVEHATDTLREFYLRHEAARGTVPVTSEGAARVASLVARLVADGRQVGLNTLGNSAVMPLTSAQEGPGQSGGTESTCIGPSVRCSATVSRMLSPRVAFLPGEPDLGHPDARHSKLPLISGKARA